MRKEEWNAHCVKMILENPVYCGRIAYGRRTLEKVKGKEINKSVFIRTIT